MIKCIYWLFETLIFCSTQAFSKCVVIPLCIYHCAAAPFGFPGPDMMAMKPGARIPGLLGSIPRHPLPVPQHYIAPPAPLPPAYPRAAPFPGQFYPDYPAGMDMMNPQAWIGAANRPPHPDFYPGVGHLLRPPETPEWGASDRSSDRKKV